MAKKIKNQKLKSLVEALGEDYESYHNLQGGWTVDKLTGKVSIKVVEEGFDVKLAIKSQDVHIVYTFKGKEKDRIYRTHRYSKLRRLVPFSKINKLEKSV